MSVAGTQSHIHTNTDSRPQNSYSHSDWCPNRATPATPPTLPQHPTPIDTPTVEVNPYISSAPTDPSVDRMGRVGLA